MDKVGSSSNALDRWFNDGANFKALVLKYSMDRKPRGLCVLINQKNFEGRKPRYGTDADAEVIEKTFTQLHFNVKRYDDLKAEQIRKVADDYSELDHSRYDCFAFVILSHGHDGIICGTDDETVTVTEVTGHFRGDKCRSLSGKPKLFFIQGCRGGKKDLGVRVGGSSIPPMKLPIEADFLIASATVSGYVSWRQEDGTCFIKSLCQVLSQNGPQGVEMMQMMTMVNGMVANEYEAQTETGTYKQMPSIETRLTKQLYFNN